MILAFCLAAVGLVAIIVVIRRRARRPRQLVAPPVVTDVLVREVAPPVSLLAPTSERLAASRGIFDRLRAMGTSVAASELAVVEEVLLRADLGVTLTTEIVDALRDHGAPEGVAAAVRTELARVFDRDRTWSLEAETGRLPVWLFVGVNGVGKTTTIGKLAARFHRDGKKVTLAAGDTFRAAAAAQLAEWGSRTGADVVRAAEGADPGSVVHDAIGRAAATGSDLVLADTAGRRANSSNLLDELAKIRRVADRGPGQVVETLLVLDATTGQNALSQAREFLHAASVTGVVLTKLDGTARGGIVAAIEQEFGLPVKFVGVGEGVDDLRPFEPTEFIDALLA